MAKKNMSDSEKKILDTFIEKLDKLMFEKKIGYDSELLSHTSITQSRFSNIRNKKTFPTIFELKEIADYFGVSLDYLLDADNNNAANKITLENLTDKDIIELLLELHINQKIVFKYLEESRRVSCSEGWIGDCGIFFRYNYLQSKLNEWVEMTEHLLYDGRSFSKEALKILKKGFIETLYDEEEMYRMLSNDEDELPFY